MPEDTNASTKDAPNASGNRRDATDNLPAGGELGGALSKAKEDTKLGDKPAGFGLDGQDVKGSLRVHIKLDLEADIRIIARVKGDIAIGLL